MSKPKTKSAGDEPDIAPAPDHVVRSNDGVATPSAPESETATAPEVPAAGDAIAAADDELKRLRAENADLTARLARHEPPAAPPGDDRPKRSFTVSYPGTHLPDGTVEAADEAAAVRTYLDRHGVTSAPVPPVVTPAE